MRDTSSPTSPGTRRSSLPVQRRPVSPLSPDYRPESVPAGACRGSSVHHLRASEREDTPPLAEARTGDSSNALEEEEWVKASWKKGECREEIKLIAEASGMAFDEARIVALRLYNHFNWLPQLQERSEQLLSVVGRERRLSLSLVRQEALAQAARELSRDSSAGSVGSEQLGGVQGDAIDSSSCGTAEEESGWNTKNRFNRYIRGLCVVCNEGSFDQTLDVLFRAYSTARDDGTITRNEVAAILAKHVVYEGSENPTAEKERMYRWLKRQFIQLTTAATASSKTVSETPGRDAEKQRGVAASVAAVAAASDPAAPTPLAAGRHKDESSFLSWDSARELLRRGPRCLENSLAIDLPCLSKDLWMADLVDIGRTKLTSSFLSDN